MMKTDPIVIGGMGGSGTRAFADMMIRGGVYTGAWMNSTLDTGGIFFERLGYAYMTDNEIESLVVLKQFVDKYFDKCPDPWGWKSPLSYLLVPLLNKVFPDMRFVHVVRDGKAIAYPNPDHPCSEDGLHRGARRYGRKFLSREEWKQPYPVVNALHWARTNKKAAEDVASLNGRGMTVRYEDLVDDPAGTAKTLAAFTGTKWDWSIVKDRASLNLDRGEEIPEMADVRAMFGYK